MTGVFFDPPRCDAAWRGKIYNGDIIILSPTPEMLALVEHTRGMIEEAFAPHWDQAIKNGSRDFNYYRWNAESRKNAAQHIGRDTRVQPHAEDPLELEPDVRFVVPPGGIIVFSGAQLHSTVPNTTNMVRWSIDFRTVNIDDVVSKRGAPNTDSASTGTSLCDFLRVADFSPIPEDIVAEYDEAIPEGGVAIFKPEMMAASAS
jgi:hypothetical protein